MKVKGNEEQKERDRKKEIRQWARKKERKCCKKNVSRLV